MASGQPGQRSCSSASAASTWACTIRPTLSADTCWRCPGCGDVWRCRPGSSGGGMRRDDPTAAFGRSPEEPTIQNERSRPGQGCNHSRILFDEGMRGDARLPACPAPVINLSSFADSRIYTAPSSDRRWTNSADSTSYGWTRKSGSASAPTGTMAQPSMGALPAEAADPGRA